MSSQGGKSSSNGNKFRDRIRDLVSRSGIPHDVEIKKYKDAQGCTLRHDILLYLEKDVVVECKFHSNHKGTMGEKLMYTAKRHEELPIKTIIVLGGPGWPKRVVSRVNAHLSDDGKVKVMDEDAWKVCLNGQNRR